MPRQKSDHVDSAAGLAQRLREARERAGMSQRALARGICTAAYVSRLEKGERIPSLQLLRRLASRLGADADELASGLAGQAYDPLLDADDAPDNPLARARLWRSQALLCEERGDRQTADRYARRALEAVAVANHTRYVTRAHKLLARVAVEPADAEQALELLDATYAVV